MNELEKLIETLPLFIQEHLNRHTHKTNLIEIVLDVGRRPEARFIYGPEYLSQKIISWQDIDYISQRINNFNSENRAGIERTLHRISCIRNRQFLITGFTCRVGRAIFGTISMIQDLLESEKSILILGRPGVGKTTIIREIGRILADEMQQRVVIIDTSNEIAGDSDIPHFGIGRARRMQVSKTELQHQVMIEAVENHMPQIIIIDEIGTELEVLAARTIAEKGIKLIGTTHGNSLKNLIKNPSLAELIGGIQYVTLSDEEAKRRKTQKSILERKTAPTFELVIEINDLTSWTIHENVAYSIDLLLRTNSGINQIRQLSVSRKTLIKWDNNTHLSSNLFLRNTKKLTKNQQSLGRLWVKLNESSDLQSLQVISKNLIIYSYSISTNFINEVVSKSKVQVVLTNDITKASLIVGSKKHLTRNLKLKKLAQEKHIPVYSLTHVSVYQILKLLQNF